MHYLVDDERLFFFVVLDGKYGWWDGWYGKHANYVVDLFWYWPSFIFKNRYFLLILTLFCFLSIYLHKKMHHNLFLVSMDEIALHLQLIH